jgi:glycerate kinase
VFGPQKGASPADIETLEAGLARLAGLLGGQPDAPGAGAAGGTGYGMAAAWGSALLPGAAEVAGFAGLPAALADAALVITGEGQYDVTSHTGKVVGAVYTLATAAGVPVAVVAGVLAVEPPAGVRRIELAALAGGSEPATAEAARWLAEAGRQLAMTCDMR